MLFWSPLAQTTPPALRALAPGSINSFLSCEGRADDPARFEGISTLVDRDARLLNGRRADDPARFEGISTGFTALSGCIEDPSAQTTPPALRALAQGHTLARFQECHRADDPARFEGIST